MITTEGIVISYIVFQSTSIIAKVYTESNGLVSFLVKGVRKQNKKKNLSLAHFQPFSILELSYKEKTTTRLQTLYQAKLSELSKTIYVDIVKTSITFFLADFLSKCLNEQKDENKYLFLKKAIHVLDTIDNGSNFHLLFLAHFTRPLGIKPVIPKGENKLYFNMSEGVFLPSEKSYELYYQLVLLFETPLSMSDSIKLSKVEKENVLNILLEYYNLHMGIKHPKSLRVLKEMLS